MSACRHLTYIYGVSNYLKLGWCPGYAFFYPPSTPRVIRGTSKLLRHPAKYLRFSKMAAGDDFTAEASLMREPESPSSSFEGLSDSFVSEETQSASPSTFVWALSFAAGISGILFGYE